MAVKAERYVPIVTALAKKYRFFAAAFRARHL